MVHVWPVSYEMAIRHLKVVEEEEEEVAAKKNVVTPATYKTAVWNLGQHCPCPDRCTRQ